MKFLIEIESGLGTLMRHVTLDFKDQQTAQTWGSKQAEALHVEKPKIRVTEITPEAVAAKKPDEKKSEAPVKRSQPRKKKVKADEGGIGRMMP